MQNDNVEKFAEQVAIDYKELKTKITELENNGKFIKLKYQIIIKKLPDIPKNKEAILPNKYIINLPTEYLDELCIIDNNLGTLPETYEVYLNLDINELKIKDIVKEVNVIIFLKKPNTIKSIEIECELGDKYGVATFSNIPKLYITGDGYLRASMDKGYWDAQELNDIQIIYKNAIFGVRVIPQPYELYIKAYFDDNVTTNLISMFNQLNDIRYINPLPNRVELVFKHDEYESSVVIYQKE